MMTMNRFSISWWNNLLIVVYLLCISLPSGNCHDSEDCPPSDDSIEASCVCGIKDVRCTIGTSLPVNSPFWTEVGDLKSPNITSVHFVLHTPDSSKVHYFPIDLFANLGPSIEDITLQNWKFTFIPDFKVNSRLNKVKSLTIVDTDNFTTIGRSAFAPLSLSLERLILTSNSLNNIDPLAFKGLKNAREIKLISNNLTSLPDNLFSDTIRLTNLSLSSNSITILNEATFRGLYQLRDLELNKNELFTINNYTFRDLTSLRSLDLSHNKINSLEPLAFQGLISIEYIDMSDNQLQFLPPDLLTYTRMLTEIDLKHNLLSRLSDGFLKQLPKTVYLKDNPWICDCNIISYKEMLLTVNSDANCTVVFDEFNETNKPVRSMEVTFKQFIVEIYKQKIGKCNTIHAKEKRSQITMASTSKLAGQSGSGRSLRTSIITYFIVILLSYLK